MKKTIIYWPAIVVLMGLFVSSTVPLGRDQGLPVSPGRVALGAEPHPNIARAIHALEAARGDLQNAAHDYCGHRVEALEATNAALNQLGGAIACEDRRGAATGEAVPTGSGSSSGAFGERHPVRKEGFAKRGAWVLWSSGRGPEATNRAFDQLELTLNCDRR